MYMSSKGYVYGMSPNRYICHLKGMYMSSKGYVYVI